MSMRRRFASRLLRGNTAAAARVWRFMRRHSPWEPSPSLRATRIYIHEHGLTVRGGPFEGLKYDRASIGAVPLVPRLTGSYEHELHPVIDQIRSRSYDRILDLGCAEGYYAVGLARLFPGSPVLASDIDAGARRLCRRTSEINRVATLTVRDGLTSIEVDAFLADHKALLVCDVEGAEEDLLLPQRDGTFALCDLLVELHDFARPGVCERIVAGFERTHEIAIITAIPPEPANYAAMLRRVPEELWLPALDENRPPGMKWMWATAL